MRTVTRSSLARNLRALSLAVSLLVLPLGAAVPVSAATSCQCTTYVYNRFGLAGGYPDAKDWNNGYLQNNGYFSTNPKVGTIVVMEPTFPGADTTYGHVGVLESIDSYGRITLRGANQTVGTALTTEHSCNNVRSTAFGTSVNGRSDISFWDATDSGPSNAEHLVVGGDFDGDGMDDLMVRKTNGLFYIDYAGNGWRTESDNSNWDVGFEKNFSVGYGSLLAEVFIGDFDGDGKDDIAARDLYGSFNFDLAGNGWLTNDQYNWDYSISKDYAYRFGGDFELFVGDFDGDNMDDIGVRKTNGQLYLDYAHNGWKTTLDDSNWEVGFKKSDAYGYNGLFEMFVGDFNGDGSDDIGVRKTNGQFYIDYSNNGWKHETNGNWDAGFKKNSAYGYGSNSLLFVADIDGDLKDDFGVRQANGQFYIDYSNNGWKNETNGNWDAGFKKSDAYGYGAGRQLFVKDVDGNGTADIGVRVSSGQFYIDYSNDGWKNETNGNWDMGFKKDDAYGFGGSFDLH